MAIRDAFKVSRKTFFNPRAWFNYDEVANQNRMLWDSIKTFLKVPTPAPITEETFEQAMARNGMTEADLPVSIKNYRQFAFVFFTLGLLALFYAFFMLFAYHSWHGWLLATAACALLFAQAFKYDFWSLQLRRRKLNLRFADWKASILGQ